MVAESSGREVVQDESSPLVMDRANASSSLSPREVHNLRNVNQHHHHNHNHYLQDRSESLPEYLSSVPLTVSDSSGGASSSGQRCATSYNSLRNLSLSHLTAKQHFLVAICRDMALVPPICSLYSSLKIAWEFFRNAQNDILYPLSLATSFQNSWATYVKNNIRHQITNFGMSNPVSNFLPNREVLDDQAWLLSALSATRSSEYLLCSLWCLVSMYLSYSILDSLMVRWIMKYSTLAAILRMFSMSLVIVTMELLLLSSLSPNGDYYLHSWILISCILTGAYIWQSFLTSHLSYVDYNIPENTSPPSSTGGVVGSGTSLSSVDRSIVPLSSQTTLLDSTQQQQQQQIQRKKKQRKNKAFRFEFAKKRSIDLYNITVFCVVPVGIASFITMLGLLRNLVIQRLDAEQVERFFKQMYQDS